MVHIFLNIWPRALISLVKCATIVPNNRDNTYPDVKFLVILTKVLLNVDKCDDETNRIFRNVSVIKMEETDLSREIAASETGAAAPLAPGPPREGWEQTANLAVMSDIEDLEARVMSSSLHGKVRPRLFSYPYPSYYTFLYHSHV